jgi:hypothetical protein
MHTVQIIRHALKARTYLRSTIFVNNQHVAVYQGNKDNTCTDQLLKQSSVDLYGNRKHITSALPNITQQQGIGKNTIQNNSPQEISIMWEQLRTQIHSIWRSTGTYVIRTWYIRVQSICTHSQTGQWVVAKLKQECDLMTQQCIK